MNTNTAEYEDPQDSSFFTGARQALSFTDAQEYGGGPSTYNLPPLDELLTREPDITAGQKPFESLVELKSEFALRSDKHHSDRTDYEVSWDTAYSRINSEPGKPLSKRTCHSYQSVLLFSMNSDDKPLSIVNKCPEHAQQGLEFLKAERPELYGPLNESIMRHEAKTQEMQVRQRKYREMMEAWLDLVGQQFNQNMMHSSFPNLPVEGEAMKGIVHRVLNGSKDDGRAPFKSVKDQEPGAVRSLVSAILSSKDVLKCEPSSLDDVGIPAALKHIRDKWSSRQDFNATK